MLRSVENQNNSRNPPPSNIGQQRSFLGLVNYYGKFVRNLHKPRALLDELLRKSSTFARTSRCRRTLENIRDAAKSDLLPTQYNPKYDIVVAVDVKDDGSGAVISHKLPDGSEKTIFHASRTLKPAERKYIEIEKEALAGVRCQEIPQNVASQEFHFVHKR